MSASDGGGAETIQVVCRLRPLSKREAGSASVLEVQDDARTVALKGASVKDFTYDRVFGPDTAQSELFEAVGRPLTEACAAGFHGTVFAYGQTGSGKTHTILGEGNGDEAGLLPRVLRHLFATTSQRTGQVRKMKLVTDAPSRCALRPAPVPPSPRLRRGPRCRIRPSAPSWRFTTSASSTCWTQPAPT